MRAAEKGGKQIAKIYAAKEVMKQNSRKKASTNTRKQAVTWKGACDKKVRKQVGLLQNK